jgi:hypothetical protein
LALFFGVRLLETALALFLECGCWKPLWLYFFGVRLLETALDEPSFRFLTKQFRRVALWFRRTPNPEQEV